MADFELSDYLMTGRLEIDESHKNLLGILSKMYDCQGNHDVVGCSKFLVDYIDEFKNHYKYELDLVMRLNNNTAFQYIELCMIYIRELNSIKLTCEKAYCKRLFCISEILFKLQSHILNNIMQFNVFPVKR